MGLDPKPYNPEPHRQALLAGQSKGRKGTIHSEGLGEVEDGGSDHIQEVVAQVAAPPQSTARQHAPQCHTRVRAACTVPLHPCRATLVLRLERIPRVPTDALVPQAGCALVCSHPWAESSAPGPTPLSWCLAQEHSQILDGSGEGALTDS